MCMMPDCCLLLPLYCSFMTRKLYALALGKCAAESADSPMMQEVLLGGHLYLMVLKVIVEWNARNTVFTHVSATSIDKSIREEF